MAGKPVLQLKLKTFFIGAALSGLAGAVYAHLTSFIAPDGFVPLLTVYIFLAATAGGYTRLSGAVVGSIAVLALLESTRFAAAAIPGLNAVQVASLRELTIAVALIAIMQLRPEGVVPKQERTCPQAEVADPDACDLRDAFRLCVACLAAGMSGREMPADWAALQQRVERCVEFQLLTVLAVDWDAQLVRRCHSSDERHYPSGGVKRLMDSSWAHQVLREGRVFRSVDASDMRTAFADHELLFSLGLNYALNVPVLRDKRVAWTLNLLRKERAYADTEIALVCELLRPRASGSRSRLSGVSREPHARSVGAPAR